MFSVSGHVGVGGYERAVIQASKTPVVGIITMGKGDIYEDQCRIKAWALGTAVNEIIDHVEIGGTGGGGICPATYAKFAVAGSLTVTAFHSTGISQYLYITVPASNRTDIS